MQTTLAAEVIGAVARLRAIGETEASGKPTPGKWSKKEILGHLIDSAANNHQRFVRLQLAREVTLPGYDQDAWVVANGYQRRAWSDLVELWAAYNVHLAAVIEGIDATCAGNIWHHQPLDPPATHSLPAPAADFKLDFLVDDYVVHMRHHLEQLGIAL